MVTHPSKHDITKQKQKKHYTLKFDPKEFIINKDLDNIINNDIIDYLHENRQMMKTSFYILRDG